MSSQQLRAAGDGLYIAFYKYTLSFRTRRVKNRKSVQIIIYTSCLIAILHHCVPQDDSKLQGTRFCIPPVPLLRSHWATICRPRKDYTKHKHSIYSA